MMKLLNRLRDMLVPSSGADDPDLWLKLSDLDDPVEESITLQEEDQGMDNLIDGTIDGLRRRIQDVHEGLPPGALLQEAGEEGI